MRKSSPQLPESPNTNTNVVRRLQGDDGGDIMLTDDAEVSSEDLGDGDLNTTRAQVEVVSENN